MTKKYSHVTEWLQDAVRDGSVDAGDLLQLVIHHVPAEAIEDTFQAELTEAYYYDQRIEVTWKCWDSYHPDDEPRQFKTTEWESDLDKVSLNGFPEVECPHCGAMMDEDDITNKRIVHER